MGSAEVIYAPDFYGTEFQNLIKSHFREMSCWPVCER